MPEGLRLANEDIRLASEGLCVAVLLKHAAESSTRTEPRFLIVSDTKR